MFSNKFKYVKFSKGTARNNPDMIIREYYRLINEIHSQLSKFLNQERTVTVKMPISRFVDYSRSVYESHVKLDAKEIIEYYEKIQKENKRELALLELLDNMKDELEMFKSKYKK